MQQRAGRYEFISQIAAGPLGALWAARVADGAETGRIVMIRRILKAPPVNERIEQELIEAAFAAMDIRHPKLAALLDVVVNQREVAIVSEYVEGELLRSLQRRSGLKNDPLQIRIGLRIGLDALQGLAGALYPEPSRVEPIRRSRTSVFAGGMCPDHILIATFGEAVLLETGVVGTAMRHPLLARHPDTCVYRAPEQLNGESPADERADVFSAGVLIWEMLANRPLFGPTKWTRYSSRRAPTEVPGATHTARSLCRRVRQAKIARLDALVRAGERVPTTIADIVGRALQRDPSERYGSVAEMIAALEQLGEPAIGSHDEVAHALRHIAGTSVEARRIALASFAGHLPSEPRRIDSSLPTLPPQRDEDAPRGAVLAPDSPAAALPAIEVAAGERSSKRNKPPLPVRRRKDAAD